MNIMQQIDELKLRPTRLNALAKVLEGRGSEVKPELLTELTEKGLLVNNGNSYEAVEGLESAFDSWLNNNPAMMRLLLP